VPHLPRLPCPHPRARLPRWRRRAWRARRRRCAAQPCRARRRLARYDGAQGRALQQPPPAWAASACACSQSPRPRPSWRCRRRWPGRRAPQQRRVPPPVRPVSVRDAERQDKTQTRRRQTTAAQPRSQGASGAQDAPCFRAWRGAGREARRERVSHKGSCTRCAPPGPQGALILRAAKRQVACSRCRACSACGTHRLPPERLYGGQLLGRPLLQHCHGEGRLISTRACMRHISASRPACAQHVRQSSRGARQDGISEKVFLGHAPLRAFRGTVGVVSSASALLGAPVVSGSPLIGSAS